MTTAAQKLGSFLENTSYESLPTEVIEETKLRIADVIGIGLSGSVTKANKIVKFVMQANQPKDCLIWGSKLKTSAEYAALANATMAFHLELDDVHRTSHTHPGISTIPSALALCQQYSLSGKDLIRAVAVGYDVCIRIGMTVSPSVYVDKKYLAPGILSAAGAAAVSAVLLGLTKEAASGALGGASYLSPVSCYESFRLGAPVKDVIMGWGGLTGILSARLAAQGFYGPDTSLDGEYGFFETVSDHYSVDSIVLSLGSAFEILNTGMKPYACCRQHHAAIDCMLDIRRQAGIKLEDVETVTVRTFTVASRGNHKSPDSVPSAKYSIPYIMAVTLEFGMAWREQFTEELLTNQRIMDFAQRVEVIADAELDRLYDEKWPSIVEVKLKDGRKFTSRYDLPKGEPEFPIALEERKSNFLSLASDAIGETKSRELWDYIISLDMQKNLNNLWKLLENNEIKKQ